MIKTIELYGGIGTTNMAFTKVFGKRNVRTVGYVEWDPKSVAQFNAIHGTNFKNCDVQKVRAKDLDFTHNGRDIFVLTNSSPCQSLSHSGKREGMAPGNNDLSSLIWESLRIIKEMFQRDPINKSHLPHYIITENVVGIHDKKNKDWFDSIITLFKKFGYECFWRDVNGKDIGEPQMRNRCFLVCVLRDCGLPPYIPYEKPKLDPVESRKQKMHEIFATTTRKEIEEEGVILADFGKNPNVLMQYPYLVNPKNKNFKPVAQNPYFCIVETSYQSINGKNFCKIYTDRVPTLLCSQANTKVVDTYNKVYRHLTAKEAWLLQNYSVSDYKKAKATGVSYNSLHKTAGDAILLNAFKQVIQQIPNKADPADCYIDNKADDISLKDSREEMYRLAYETYNRINKANLAVVLPKSDLAEFGRETDSKKRLRKHKQEENYVVRKRIWSDSIPEKTNGYSRIMRTLNKNYEEAQMNNFEITKGQVSRGVNKQLTLDVALFLVDRSQLFENYFKSERAFIWTQVVLEYAKCFCYFKEDSLSVSAYDYWVKNYQHLDDYYKELFGENNVSLLDEYEQNKKVIKELALKMYVYVFKKYDFNTVYEFLD